MGRKSSGLFHFPSHWFDQEGLCCSWGRTNSRCILKIQHALHYSNAQRCHADYAKMLKHRPKPGISELKTGESLILRLSTSCNMVQHGATWCNMVQSIVLLYTSRNKSEIPGGLQKVKGRNRCDSVPRNRCLDATEEQRANEVPIFAPVVPIFDLVLCTFHAFHASWSLRAKARASKPGRRNRSWSCASLVQRCMLHMLRVASVKQGGRC